MLTRLLHFIMMDGFFCKIFKYCDINAHNPYISYYVKKTPNLLKAPLPNPPQKQKKKPKSFSILITCNNMLKMAAVLFC